VHWGPYHRFTIRDPKQRVICEPPFRDQVAQHAILNVAEPIFEAYQIHDSYACRKRKGVDAALRRAMTFAGRGGWFLKLDVRKSGLPGVSAPLGFGEAESQPLSRQVATLRRELPNRAVERSGNRPACRIPAGLCAPSRVP